MSLDTAPLLRKKQDFAFALETATGTPATINAAAAVTPVFNPSIKMSTEVVARETLGSLSPIRQGLGAQSAEATFETELFGGTTPYWTNLLLGCGLVANTGAYTPTDDATQTLTLAQYINGRERSMLGCMGTFKIMFKRGQAARVQWTFKGLPQALAAATISPTRVNTIAPLVGTGAFTSGGNTFRVNEVTFDAGNSVILREDVGSPGGYRAAYITDRKPTISFAAESVIATNNSANFLASNTIAFSLAVGNVTGSIWTLAAGALQLNKDPEDGERNGMLTDVLEYLCTSPSGAGQDEYSLTLT